MAKFQFVDLTSGEALDYATRQVEKEKVITTKVIMPLWSSVGQRVPLEKVAEAGLKVQFVPDQTQDYINWKRFSAMYTAIPEFVTRVTELKQHYDDLGVGYNATTDQIEVALNTLYPTDADAKAIKLAQINASILNVKLNFQAGDSTLEGTEGSVVNDFIMWRDFPKLIKWHPATGTAEPAYTPPVDVTSAEQETQIKADWDAAIVAAQQAAEAEAEALAANGVE